MFFDFNFKKMVAKTSPIVGIVRIIERALPLISLIFEIMDSYKGV